MIVIGASGHGKTFIDVKGDQLIDAFYDDLPKVSQIHGIPVHDLKEEEWEGVKIGIIGIGDNQTRKRIVQRLQGKIQYLNLLHPSVIKSDFSIWGEGIVAMEGSIIKMDVVLGDHVIVNTGTSIDHDCILGNFVHLAPQVTLCGDVKIGEGVMVGAGSVVLPGVEIGDWSVIGAGSIVHKNVPNRSKWIGDRLKINPDSK